VEAAEDGRWRTTILGNAVAKASFARPTKRETATRQYNALLGRVAEANANELFIHWVDRVVLFGSFLDPEQDPVGDVDLDLHLSPWWTTEDFRERLEAHNYAYPKNHSTFFERMSWPERHLLQFLRIGAPVLSLSQDDPIVEQVAHRMVYERKGP
jgi:hypothetical protein